MTDLRFDNRFVRELPADPEAGRHVRQVHGACYSRVEPTPVRAPTLLAWSPEVAALLGIDEADIRSQDFAEVFAGNALLPGMEPYAACYGGHQFGNWAGQLGDGRAHLLGEVIDTLGQRRDIAFKGSGRTPFSRGGDGKASMLQDFEAGRRSEIEVITGAVLREAEGHGVDVPVNRALFTVPAHQAVCQYQHANRCR